MQTILTAEKIYFVSCVGKKETRAFPAKDLYQSTWFKKARMFVESKKAPWFILSAKYGLISPNKIIKPYDQTLNSMVIAERRDWADKVIARMLISAPAIKKAVILAGKRYYEFIATELQKRKIEVTIPMKNLGIGKQLQWMDQNHGKAR